jgi:hypothetical protein
MTALEIGKCGIDGTEIFSRVRGRMVANAEYAEVVLAFSNGTVARHGVCRKCAESLTDEKIETLTERIKETWKNELVGKGTDKQFEKIDQMKTEIYGNDKDSVIIEYKVKKEKDHKELVKLKIKK